VPTQFYGDLLHRAFMSCVWPRAEVVMMESAAVEIPVVRRTTAPASGDSADFGTMTVAWVEDGQAVTENEPLFNLAQLKARQLRAVARTTNAVLGGLGEGIYCGSSRTCCTVPVRRPSSAATVLASRLALSIVAL